MSYSAQQPPTSPPPPPGSVPPGFPPPGSAPVAGRPPRNTFGLVSLILGIVAFVTAFVPIVNYAAVFLALAGLVLGVIALFFAARRKGTAIAGLILSFVALIVSIVLAIVYTFVFFGHLIGSAVESDPIDGTELSLIYQVDGIGADVDVTYTAFDDGMQVTKQATGQRLPFEEEFVVGFGGADTYNTYTITAVNGAGDGDVTCRIILDDRVLIERTASGEFATATCTASGTELLEG